MQRPDFADIGVSEGDERVRRCLDEAEPFPNGAATEPQPESERSREYDKAKRDADGTEGQGESLIAELATLSPLQYARRRKAAAKEIGLLVSALDKLVKEARTAENAGAAQPAHWDVEPSSEPVAGAALLDDIVNLFLRYVMLPEHAREALALWVAHAWALDAFQCSPFATLVSPTKRCGKTRLLALLKWLTPRSELAGSISAAALFRYIEQERPTLLIDEADRTVAGNDELQGILNSSHKRVAAYVIRCVGDDNRPRRFSTWAPKAIATIARLADTLRDRSIIIQMRRKTAQERIEPWNEDDTKELAALRRRLLRWTEDQAKVLISAFPDVPTGLNDRAADNWRPLLAIADAAGGSWPSRARAAALGLSGRLEDDDDPLIRMLADIRAIFGEMPSADWIGSAVLAERLASQDGSPWQEWKRGKPITPASVARILRRAGIHPTRQASSNRYQRAHFTDAWTRYVPEDG
jgi:putative DNA primase/helicase